MVSVIMEYDSHIYTSMRGELCARSLYTDRDGG